MAVSPDPAVALAAIGGIRDAADMPRLLVRLFEVTAAIGATACVYAVAIPEDEQESSCFAMFACDPSFAQDQLMRGAIHHHPWFRFARTRILAATDTDLPANSEHDRATIDLARRHGFASCLILPTATQVGLGRLDVLCLGSSQDKWFDHDDARTTRLLARVMAAELNAWFTRHLRENLRSAANISAADLCLLAYERQGLGTKAIASRIGQSKAAVDSRFQRINNRMNCASRAASARRAAEYGLLDRL
jgi:hypothetical protein